MSNTFFVHFLKHSFIRLLEVKNFSLIARLSFKRNLFLLYLQFKSKLGLKSVIKKEKKAHRGGEGSEKCQKRVTYHLNGPKLILYFICQLRVIL
jgi:hypothetical protein